jgi:hypothetical protein
VGCVGFSTKSKNQHTPLQSRGTRQRAFFAVRKQHTKQVTPVEPARPKAGEPPALPGFLTETGDFAMTLGRLVDEHAACDDNKLRYSCVVFLHFSDPCLSLSKKKGDNPYAAACT